MLLLGVVFAVLVIIKTALFFGQKGSKNIIEQGTDPINKAREIKDLIEVNVIDENEITTEKTMPEEKKLAIEKYLLTQKDFVWQTKKNSHNFCEILSLSEDPNQLFPVYIWVRCGEFTYLSGEVKEENGVSLPAKINYPNELSFYDLNRFSHEIPRDDSFNSEDIKRIFPAYEQKQISNSKVRSIMDTILTEKAQSWFEAN